jgi:hypothetical protein
MADLFKIVESGVPSTIGKIGNSEMVALHCALLKQNLNQGDLHNIFTVAGVFPPTERGLNDFVGEFSSSLSQVDVLAKWRDEREDVLIATYCPTASLVALRELEPFYWENPWSAALEGKKVLVISPFTDTITSQYDNRLHLWQDSTVLPPMELSTIKCPVSHYLQPSPYESWLEGLEDMKNQMSIQDFDVCLIGAGAWSLPLAAHAKRLGKIGIHLGGGLQVLFGIKGKRWDKHDVISNFYNDYWVRPSETETPAKAFMVEEGCYW